MHKNIFLGMTKVIHLGLARSCTFFLYTNQLVFVSYCAFSWPYPPLNILKLITVNFRLPTQKSSIFSVALSWGSRKGTSMRLDVPFREPQLKATLKIEDF